jgi:MFS family permease
MTTTAGRPADRRGGAQRAVLPVVMLALATVVAAVASLNVALPSIARDTHASQTQLSWVIDAYALPFAALLLLGGAIGDRYGRRRALIAGLAIFGAGSLAAMNVHDPSWLIAMRAVLGAGAALVMPATLSTITATFPPDQRAGAVGAWAGVAGASALVGVLASGLLLQAWSWRSVFGLNVTLAVVALVATVWVIPESADPEAGRLDVVGALLTTAGLGLATYSIIEAPTEGWSSARTLAGIAAGLVVLAGFVGWELRRPSPLLDPRLFAHRAFAAATLSITLQFFAFFGPSSRRASRASPGSRQAVGRSRALGSSFVNRPPCHSSWWPAGTSWRCQVVRSTPRTSASRSVENGRNGARATAMPAMAWTEVARLRAAASRSTLTVFQGSSR